MLDEQAEDEIDSGDSDDYLGYLSDILTTIHEKFYKEYDEIKRITHEDEQLKIPDLKKLIPSIRSQTLRKKGPVNIVFTGLIPIKLPLEKSKMCDLAMKLGATVQSELKHLNCASWEKTTHVIASNPSTSKAQEAEKLTGVHVVSPLWLYSCSQRWEHVEEKLFQLNKSDDFRNPDKLKTMNLSFDEQLFLNQDLVKLSNLAKKLRAENERAKAERPQIEKLQIDKAQQASKPTFTPFPVYDPLTGKLIRTDQPQKSQSSVKQPQPTSSKQAPADEEESFLKEQEADLLTPHSMLELNPLCAFTTADLKMMDEEVDDACSDEDNESESNEREPEFEVNDEMDYDEDSAEYDYGDEPPAKRYKREVECLTASSSEDASNLSFEDSNLAAELEKDFLP